MSALAVETSKPYLRLPVKVRKDGNLRIADKEGAARKQIVAALRKEQLLVLDFRRKKTGIGCKRILGLVRQTCSFVQYHSPEGAFILLTGFNEETSMSVERALVKAAALVQVSDREFAFSEKTRTVYSTGFTLRIDPWQRSNRNRKTYEKLIERDGAACVWCGVELGADNHWATIDHVVPRAAGGVNHFDNYVLSCEPCNSQRRAVDAADWMQECLGQLHHGRYVNIFAVLDAIERASTLEHRALVPIS
jgi:hypothetical protein